MTDWQENLGRLGVWASDFRFGDEAFVRNAAAELEDLGYGAIWFPGGRGGDLMARISMVLDATTRCTVATGILNIWMHEPSEVGAWWRSLPSCQQERVMVGLGVGHAPSIGDAWRQPLAKMSAYLDDLDAEGFPPNRRCIAALGPKMLDLARERAAGAHPYLVPTNHTAMASQRLGSGHLLAPEQGVILDESPESARRKAREQLDTYAHLPNYRASWKRLGFTDEEIAGLGDRLIDEIFAWGSIEKIVDRIEAHFAAGASHVCIQAILGSTGTKDAEELRRVWHALAPEMRYYVDNSSGLSV